MRAAVARRFDLRERAKPVIAKFTQEIGEPLVKEVVAQVEKVRAGK